MITFDDYNFKDVSINKKMEFKAIRDKMENPWNTTNGVKRIISTLYKIDLMDSIKIALREGIHPSKIFIMENNFTNEHDWEDLTGTNRIKTFYKLHYSGSITPMAYNKFHVEISLLISFVREIRKTLNEQEHRTINDAEYEDFIKDRKLSKIQYNFIYIIEEIVKIITLKNRFEKDLEYIVETSNKIASKYIRRIEEYTNKKSDENYFFYFFNKFKELDRPIVCIMDDFPSFNFKVLCQHVVIYNEDYPNAFLDLYSLSHESPIKYLLGVGTIACTMFGLYITSQHYNYQNEKSQAEIVYMKERTKLISIQKDREKYEACMDYYKKVDEQLSPDIEKECKSYLQKYSINFDNVEL